MAFWLIAALAALVVTGILALAMLRGGRSAAAPSASYDVEVYRNQLKELERDLARGTLGEDEAARTRVEISRRLLEADRAAKSATAGSAAPRGLSLGVLALSALVVLGGGFWLYWGLGVNRPGEPNYEDMPLKARIAAAAEARENRPAQAEAEAGMPEWAGPPPDAPADYLALIEKLRAAVASRPDDLQGQTLLADHEAALGNYVGAYQAMGRAIAIKGGVATADDYARYADLMIMATGGYVSPEAEGAIARALQVDPDNGVARYYSGLMFAQTGRPDYAFEIWRNLLEQSTADAPWNVPIRAQIEQLAAMAGVDYTPPATAALRGPSAADIAAAGDMSAEDQSAMINQMVTNLSERLATEGGTAEEWARLINALGVLGQTDRASAIWAEAQTVFAADPQALATITTAARAAGVAE